MVKFLRKDVLILMILNYFLQYWNEILSVVGFAFTLFTLLATLNVRSQIIHSHERQNFQANYNQIIGKLNGFIASLVENGLNTPSFYQQIDIYMTDLTSQYTFFNILIKLKCKHISHILISPADSVGFRTDLTKKITSLRNSLSKEANL